MLFFNKSIAINTFLDSLISVEAAMRIQKQLRGNGFFFLRCRCRAAGRPAELRERRLDGGLPVLWRRDPFRRTRDGRLLVWGVDRQNEVTWLRPQSWPLKYDILCTGWGAEGERSM